MVGWYEVRQLALTAVRAVLSALFGTYADKRETMAALTEKRTYDYSDSAELWTDYISDTGDGFDSTFSMAALVSKANIEVDFEDKPLSLERGRLIVFGGDQVYPTATREEYVNRFIGPIEAASIQMAPEVESDLFAIPGNHDWYDGLDNFTRIFCSSNEIGNFCTSQNRSYFAIKLTHNTWIWATDVQLESDLDHEQIQYFKWVAKAKMEQGDNVILYTAEPCWVYHNLRKEDTSYHRLKEFEEEVIQGNGLNQVLTVAGDLHHYSRYSRVDENGKEQHKLTAGGGGAFLHPTHNLPVNLKNMREGDFDLKVTYPNISTSKKLTFRNLLFPYLNPSFGLFLSAIHLIMAYSLVNTSLLDPYPGSVFTDFRMTSDFFNNEILTRLFRTFIHSPISMLILLMFIFGFKLFCDAKSSKYKLASSLGTLHGIAHIVLMISSLSFFAWFTYDILHVPEGVWTTVVVSIEVFLVGGLISGVLIGLYLLVSSLVLKMHDNEAFSSLKIGGYKNFLRLHIKDDKLTIYPIGIKDAPKWTKQDGKFISKTPLKPFLIDQPIEIDLN